MSLRLIVGLEIKNLNDFCAKLQVPLYVVTL